MPSQRATCYPRLVLLRSVAQDFRRITSKFGNSGEKGEKSNSNSPDVWGIFYLQLRMTLSNKWKSLFFFCHLYSFDFYLFLFDLTNSTTLYCIFLSFLFDPDEKRPTRRRTIRWGGRDRTQCTYRSSNGTPGSSRMSGRFQTAVEDVGGVGNRKKRESARKEMTDRDRQIMTIIKTGLIGSLDD